MLVFTQRYAGRALTYIGAGLDGQVGDTLLLTLQDTGSLGVVDVIDRGEWWRLLSTHFIHEGALHLGLSMYGLLVLGPLLEKMWGRAGFVAVYLASCLGTSAVSLVFSPAMFTLALPEPGAGCWVRWQPGFT